tara:strand:+ start:461 stop:763 length:303 start_codon:yes stop_codon:yes gene_type:complete
MTTLTETRFQKDEFTWDGMYLMYRGRHTNSVNMEIARPNCHPSWIGKPQPEFIARFKYGYKPYKAWINFIVKNFTVEEYLQLEKDTSPRQAMESKGYRGK